METGLLALILWILWSRDVTVSPRKSEPGEPRCVRLRERVGKRVGIRKWALICLALAVVAVTAYAATHSLTYTTAQDNAIQNRLINSYNREKCARYGRPPGCSSANLTASGCVPISICTAAGLVVGSNACTTFSTEFTESCVIFTNNAAGEAAYLKEAANRQMVADYAKSVAQSSQDFKTAFNAATQVNKDHCCTDVGLSAGCDGP